MVKCSSSQTWGSINIPLRSCYNLDSRTEPSELVQLLWGGAWECASLTSSQLCWCFWYEDHTFLENHWFTIHKLTDHFLRQIMRLKREYESRKGRRKKEKGRIRIAIRPITLSIFSEARISEQKSWKCNVYLWNWHSALTLGIENRNF